VVPVPKGSLPAVGSYRSISITPVLSKVFQKFVARRLNRYSEQDELLPPCQFAYRKGVRVMHFPLYFTIFNLLCIKVGNPGWFSCATQRVVVDGKLSESIDIVSSVPEDSILSPLLFVNYTMDMFTVVRNCFVHYEDDSTLFAAIPHNTQRPATAEYLNADLARINE